MKKKMEEDSDYEPEKDSKQMITHSTPEKHDLTVDNFTSQYNALPVGSLVTDQMRMESIISEKNVLGKIKPTFGVSYKETRLDDEPLMRSVTKTLSRYDSIQENTNAKDNSFEVLLEDDKEDLPTQRPEPIKKTATKKEKQLQSNRGNVLESFFSKYENELSSEQEQLQPSNFGRRLKHNMSFVSGGKYEDNPALKANRLSVKGYVKMRNQGSLDHLPNNIVDDKIDEDEPQIAERKPSVSPTPQPLDSVYSSNRNQLQESFSTPHIGVFTTLPNSNFGEMPSIQAGKLRWSISKNMSRDSIMMPTRDRVRVTEHHRNLFDAFRSVASSEMETPIQRKTAVFAKKRATMAPTLNTISHDQLPAAASAMTGLRRSSNVSTVNLKAIDQQETGVRHRNKLALKSLNNHLSDILGGRRDRKSQ